MSIVAVYEWRAEERLAQSGGEAEGRQMRLLGGRRLDHLGELELLLHLRLSSLGVLHGEEGVPWDVDEVDCQQAVLEGDDLSLALRSDISPPSLIVVTYALWMSAALSWGKVGTYLVNGLEWDEAARQYWHGEEVGDVPSRAPCECESGGAARPQPYDGRAGVDSKLALACLDQLTASSW